MSYRTFRVSTMTCMNCGHAQRCKFETLDGAEVDPACHSCGDALWMSLPSLTAAPPECPSCGSFVAPEANYCGACGHPLKDMGIVTGHHFQFGPPMGMVELDGHATRDALRRFTEALLNPEALEDCEIEIIDLPEEP